MDGLFVLEHKIKDLMALFETMPQVQTVFIFGSYGTEYQTPLSDVDFAFLFTEKISLSHEAEILNRLSIVLDTDLVDLVNLNKAPLLLQYHAIAAGKIIYERDYITTCNFMEYVINHYQDYSLTLYKFNQIYDQSLQEAYLHGR